MNKQSIYIETTIISYLAAKPSRDIIVQAHQQITHDWWDYEKDNFKLFVSEIVLQEIQVGDKEAANRRKSLIKGIEVLELKDRISKLARKLAKYLNIPPKSQLDAVLLSFAIEYQIDYLLTWNCSHLANGFIISRLKKFEQLSSRTIPVIVTPEELLLGGEKFEMD
jgi:hypothetical protein